MTGEGPSWLYRENKRILHLREDQKYLNMRKESKFHNRGGSTMGEGFGESNDQQPQMWRLIQRNVRYTSLLDALRKTEHMAGPIQSPF